MPKKFNKLQSWQIFKIAIKHLTPGALAHIFGKANVRTVYLYAADPDFTEKRCKDPIEAIHMMFSLLDEIGRGDAARAGLAYLQTAIDDSHPQAVEELQSTVEKELLKDFSAVTELQRAIEIGEPVEVVAEATQQAVEEIQRTFAKYCLENR